MANASGGLHDAYESAYLIWRKTFFATRSPGQYLAVFLHSQNNAVLLYDRRPVSRRMEASLLTKSNSECSCQLS